MGECARNLHLIRLASVEQLPSRYEKFEKTSWALLFAFVGVEREREREVDGSSIQSTRMLRLFRQRWENENLFSRHVREVTNDYEYTEMTCY